MHNLWILFLFFITKKCIQVYKYTTYLVQAFWTFWKMKKNQFIQILNNCTPWILNLEYSLSDKNILYKFSFTEFSVKNISDRLKNKMYCTYTQKKNWNVEISSKIIFWYLSRYPKKTVFQFKVVQLTYYYIILFIHCINFKLNTK